MRILPNPGGGAKIVSMVSSPVVYGGDTVAHINTSRHLFLGDIDTLGNMIQSKVVRTVIQNLTMVKSASQGDILIAGTFKDGFCRVGSETLTSNVSPSYYVARISSTGQVKWLQEIVPESKWGAAIEIQGILETSTGNIIVATNPWSFYSSFWGRCPEDIRYVTLNALHGGTGQPLWQQDLLSATAAMVTDIKEAANGDLYLTGAYSGKLRANNRQTALSILPADCNTLSGFRMRVSPQGQVLRLLTSQAGLIPHKIEMLANGAYATLGRINYSTFLNTDRAIERPGLVLNIFSPTDQLVTSQRLTETYDDDSRIDMIQHEGRLLMAGNYYGNLAERQIFIPDFPAPVEKWIFMAQFNVSDFTSFSALPPIQYTDISIFPNPTTDVLNITVRDNIFEIDEVNIYHAAGQLVEKIPQVGGRTQLSIAVSHLTPGTYLLQIGPVSSNTIFKFVKQ